MVVVRIRRMMGDDHVRLTLPDRTLNEPTNEARAERKLAFAMPCKEEEADRQPVRRIRIVLQLTVLRTESPRLCLPICGIKKATSLLFRKTVAQYLFAKVQVPISPPNSPIQYPQSLQNVSYYP